MGPGSIFYFRGRDGAGGRRLFVYQVGDQKKRELTCELLNLYCHLKSMYPMNNLTRSQIRKTILNVEMEPQSVVIFAVVTGCEKETCHIMIIPISQPKKK